MKLLIHTPLGQQEATAAAREKLIGIVQYNAAIMAASDSCIAGIAYAVNINWKLAFKEFKKLYKKSVRLESCLRL